MLKKNPVILEFLLVLAVTAAAILASMQVDFLELIYELSREYEAYEIDEIFSAAIGLSVFLFLLLAWRWSETRKYLQQISKKNLDLEKAMAEIRVLKGILPLCSFCKRIRNDEGTWEPVDTYIHNHTNANVSHGLCPECAQKYYPEEFPSG